MESPTTDRGKEAASRRTFDRWAGSFDRSRLLASWRTHALEELALATDDRFLDVACGGGRLVLQAAPRVARAAGIDISPRMLERAQARADDITGTQVDFRQGSAQDLPFGAGEFTAVACTAALHHFPDPAGAVNEMARVVAPHGRVLLADICADTPPIRALDAVLRRVEAGHVRFQHTRDLRELLRDTGLTVTRTSHRLAHSYVLVSATKS